MMKLTITSATAKGLRSYQEDRFVATYILDGYFMAVMDGHGGDGVAEMVAKVIEEAWNKSAESQITPEERLKALFAEMHTLTSQYNDGSTLSVVWVPDSKDVPKAYVAVLGDSPVVIRGTDGINISPEHNVRSNEVEAQVVKDRGGWVSDGYAIASFYGPGLQMSRALGDARLASILSRDPDVYSVDLTPNSFILVATDGVFDPGHQETHAAIDEIALMIADGREASDIVKRAVDKRTGDNATAILARIG